MEPARIDNFIDEKFSQSVRTDVLVTSVYPAFGDVFAELVAKMAVVVKQRGGYHDWRLTGLLREGRGL
jgi:hypothetical protein